MNISVNLFIFVVFITIYGIELTTTTTPPSAETIIQIPQGKLQGIQQTARNGRPYAAFLGVPFGKSLRFEESVPADSWNGTRDATKFGESCLQNDVFVERKIVGSEDCLFLNIYTPDPTKKSKSLLPVMVFIHGGGFQFGSGKLGDGKYFMSEDVVLVFINYRLGLFGFMKTANNANLGLKDQVLALKWVQQNIEYFGGDPKSVTIFGESAGGVSVSLHLLSPLSKGLFHRAISQSGVANSPFSEITNPGRELRKLGILMDCPVSNQDNLIQCLKTFDGKDLLKRISIATKISMRESKTKVCVWKGLYQFWAQTQEEPTEFLPEDIPKFVFSVDSDSTGNVFLPDTPLNLLRKGDFPSVPWINGVNEVEALFFPGSSDLADLFRISWNSKDATSLSLLDSDCKDLNAIREYYIGGVNINDPMTASTNVENLMSDRFLNHPAKVASTFYAKRAPAYLYHFALRGPSSFLGDLNPSDENGLKRPTHMDEMQYQFQVGNFYPEIKADSKYAPFSEFFVKLWVSFAKDGTVSPEKLSSTASAWTPISSTSDISDDIAWYQLDNRSKMIKESQIFKSRLNFWNNLLGIE